ncbi:MAG: hypothetical protein ACYC27_03005 [Armatimonadota bacterium]
MKERSIRLTAQEIQGYLHDNLRQIRRLIVPQPTGPNRPGSSMMDFYNRKGEWIGALSTRTSIHNVTCPVGKVDDVLWVRETFFVNYHKYDWPRFTIEELREQTFYRVDGLPDMEGEENDIRWSPSCHMPRWASRFNLRITSIKIEKEGDQWYWVYGSKLVESETPAAPGGGPVE